MIGWNYDKVRAKLTNMGLDENFVEQKPSDLKLLISKRPRDDGTSNTLPKSKTTEALIVEDDYENRNKLELDFSLKIQPDMFAREGSVSFFPCFFSKLLLLEAFVVSKKIIKFFLCW